MNYLEHTKDFTKILDFIRFGLSMAHKNSIYFGHGTDNALDDIYFLVLETLNLPLDIDSMFLNATLTSAEKELLTKNLFKRIKERVPSSYLVNKAYFCELEFFVDERVLIPRSPIAELIQNKFTPWIDEDNVEQILDLCTGSGCIAIALVYAFPWATVDASDISKDCLEVAKINKDNHQLDEQLNLYQSDCLKDIPKKQYDIIISNPPYVDIEEKSILPKEYLHEPDLALYTENKGMKIVQDILENAADYLTEQGILVVEVGNLKDEVIQKFSDVPFVWLEFENGGDGIFLLTKNSLKANFK